jgi:hypothetical protein
MDNMWVLLACLPALVDFSLLTSSCRPNQNTLADFSRIDLYVRSGLGEYLRRGNHVSANGGVVFAYLKEIPLFTRFHVRSSLQTWDRKWFVIEHRMETQDGSKVFAIGHSRIVVKERSGKTIPPQKVVEEMRDLGILPGWGSIPQSDEEGMKKVVIQAPKAEDCCRAVMEAEKALELHALAEELEHHGKGWVVGTVDGGNERV